MTLRDLDPPIDPPADAAADFEPALLRPGQLTPAWSTLVSVSWGLIIAGLIALGSTSVKVGKPTFWIGDNIPATPTITWLVPFALPGVALLAAARNRSWTVYASAAAAVSCVLVGVVDLSSTPGVAIGEIGMGVAGALLTAASFAGRLRKA